jgi:hypothetical protein
MGRSIWAVICGMIVASLWIAAFRLVHGFCFPQFAELDLRDREAVARFLAENPKILIGLAVAYFAGTFMGAWIGARTAPRKPILHGLIVGLLLYGLGSLHPQALPHPIWFRIVGLATFAGAGSLGGWVASLTTPKPTSKPTVDLA